MTDPNAAALQAQIGALRRLGPEGRARVGAELSEAARRMAIEGMMRRRPDLSFEEARWEVMRHVWGAEGEWAAAQRVPPVGG